MCVVGRFWGPRSGIEDGGGDEGAHGGAEKCGGSGKTGLRMHTGLGGQGAAAKGREAERRQGINAWHEAYTGAAGSRRRSTPAKGLPAVTRGPGAGGLPQGAKRVQAPAI